MGIQQTNIPNIQQTLEVNGQLILQKVILNRLLDQFNELLSQKTDNENFKMGNLSIKDKMESLPVRHIKQHIPKNNAIFMISDQAYNKLEDIKSNSIKNFIEIESKFYALRDITSDCQLIADSTQNNQKYFIGVCYGGKYLIINEEGHDIIIDAQYHQGEQTYKQFSKKYQIYNSDIMEEIKLLEKQLRQKTIYKILFIISILIILLLLIYIIYINYYKQPKDIIEEVEENDIDNIDDNNTNNINELMN